jgi:hypothetical protein
MKFLISEQEKHRILKMHLKEGMGSFSNKQLLTEAFNLSYVGNGEYAVGSVDPSLFIDKYVTDLVAKIDADPEGKKMRLSPAGMYCSSINIIAGASNSWGGKATGFDHNNNWTPATPTETDLYQKNKDLALKRANSFETYLFQKLAKFNIKKDPDLTKVTSSSWVMDTGGKTDKDPTRDSVTYRNMGQFIKCTMRFKTVDEIKDLMTLTTIDEISAKMVSSGTYFCNGRNSQGGTGQPDDYEKQCPVGLRDASHIAAFEIKWAPGVMKNTYTVPLVRWNFYWDAKTKKIIKITRQQYNNTYPIDKKFPPSSNVAKNDPTLIYMMGISEGNTTTSNQRYSKYVTPY